MPYECTICPLSNNRYEIAEGPFYDRKSNKLYIVDYFKGNVVCFDLQNDTITSRSVIVDGHTTFVIPFDDQSNRLLVSKVTKDKSSICEFNFETSDTKELESLDKSLRTTLNDAKCDSIGRLWTGSIGIPTEGLNFPDGRGSMYSYDGKKLINHIGGITASNGISWSPDEKTMYFIDTLSYKIFSCDFDLMNGTIDNKQMIFDYKTDFEQPTVTGSIDEGPDGMAIDIDGNLWVASFSGGRILHLDPRSKTLIDYIQMPVPNITSICFGGDDMTTMYVTSGYWSLSDEKRKQYPDSGAVFEVKLNKRIVGVENVRFRTC